VRHSRFVAERCPLVSARHLPRSRLLSPEFRFRACPSAYSSARIVCIAESPVHHPLTAEQIHVRNSSIFHPKRRDYFGLRQVREARLDRNFFARPPVLRSSPGPSSRSTSAKSLTPLLSRGRGAGRQQVKNVSRGNPAAREQPGPRTGFGGAKQQHRGLLPTAGAGSAV